LGRDRISQRKVEKGMGNRKSMKVITACSIACLVLVVMLAGCTSTTSVQPLTPAPTTSVMVSTPAPTSVPVTDPTLLGTWNLKSMVLQGGTAFTFPTNTQITATFDNQGNVVGFAGCNNYNAQYTLSGQQLYTGMGITIGPIVSTKKYCADTSDTETTYLQILQKAITYTVNGDGLTITDNINSMLVYNRYAVKIIFLGGRVGWEFQPDNQFPELFIHYRNQ
jgi:heat shock protein HslJ